MVFCLLGGITAGCRKTIPEEEKTALVIRCQKDAEEFRDQLADFKRFLETHRDRLADFPKLRVRLKAALEKANRARKGLSAAMKNVPQGSLMTRGQANDLTDALDRVTEARKCLQEVVTEGRRRLEKKGKRHPK